MSDGWRLIYEGFDPESESLREALCTLGNGRFATRGAASWAADDGTHYPGTYIAGGYDRLTSNVSGRGVVNEDLVNFPNWLPLAFAVEDGPEICDPSTEFVDYRQELDTREGILHVAFTAKDAEGRETRVSSRRVVSMADPALAGIEMEIVPVNWSGTIHVRSGLDGAVANKGVARYRQLRGDHVNVQRTGAAPDGVIWLHAETKQSGMGVALAARTTVTRGDETVPASDIRGGEAAIDTIYSADVDAGCMVRVEKLVCLRTTRDPALGDLLEDTRLGAERGPSFDQLEAAHRTAWAQLWDLYDVEIDVSPDMDLVPHPISLILRLHTFHLLQTASPHTADLDVHVAARGLHGEAYRGHIFWDEMYLFPFYLLRDTELAKALLMYRYRRLGEAKAAAVADGHDGAMFPWQSGSSGREETQVIHLNPKSGKWDPDHSHLQRHVNAAIAVDVWSYIETTGDLAFLTRYGAEMLLEIARFWASMSTKRRDGGYEIVGVMGSDEYHEAYPGAETGGLRNNAYTNVMAAWCIDKATAALDALDERARESLCLRLDVTHADLERWRSIVEGMTIPVLEGGIIEQFEGYGDLAELDWDAYRAKYGRIGRLDRILKAEGDSPDLYKLSKQADVCMLFYLFDPEELRAILRRSGYEMTDELLHETIEYYRQRTSHGSTLSHLVFAAILDGLDRDASWGHFVDALRSDVDDIQGGTTQEGIHTAVMAGTVRHIIERFAGLRARSDGLTVNPRLPRGIHRVRFHVTWHDIQVGIEVTADCVRVDVPAESARSVPVCVGEVSSQAQAGVPIELSYAAS